MPENPSPFQHAIAAFIEERLAAKLAKLDDDDPKCAALREQHQYFTWLDDAARRVRQIQLVTHTLKPIHPDARGSNLYAPPSTLADYPELGSHALLGMHADDVVGNAAALDVYKLLKLQIDGRSLLDWLRDGHPDAVAALSDDADDAHTLAEAFVGIAQPRTGGPASHSYAKQVFWLVGDDPLDDGQYHLLSPLYPSSLAHALFAVLNEHRYGEANKLAREALRARRDHDQPFYSYPSLAVQKLGGSKPQNISQLNSERGGNNYLLSSLPPVWQTHKVRPPTGASVFDLFGRHDDVHRLVNGLRHFLESSPPDKADGDAPGPKNNRHTRDIRDRYYADLIDELVLFGEELQEQLPANWSADADCVLHEAEKLWLDPYRCETDPEFCASWMAMDWPAEVGRRFANWLNKQLERRLPLGEVEMRHWRKELLVDERLDGWARHLHRLRREQDAPAYIPTRAATREAT